MTQQDEQLPALGQPDAEPELDGDSDFATEHADTAVDRTAIDGTQGEQESPRGWDGMDRDPAP